MKYGGQVVTNPKVSVSKQLHDIIRVGLVQVHTSQVVVKHPVGQQKWVVVDTFQGHGYWTQVRESLLQGLELLLLAVHSCITHEVRDIPVTKAPPS